MHDELNESSKLEVWVLVPTSDKVMVITLKWIYKVKLDELGGFSQNMVVSGSWLRQEEELILKSLLLDFSKGSVDLTLFIRKKGKELLLVQVYVDDIIFAASTPEIYDLFAKIMCSKFKMSMIGKQSPFLRNTVIDYSCDKGYPTWGGKSKLDEDKEGKAVDPSHYRDMIDTLIYLTANRPDLQFAIYMCARYQARPTEKHLHAVKRIFRLSRSTSGSMQFWEIDLLAGHQKGRKALRYPVRKLNILLCRVVVLKSFG
ncbi:retrovirus-related pol polyprotein from transposon TNT 1-94 [Tanacetum coccineum]|uniref:Retrovirus-related pol polyprotein from transposon TNT 1-94 n=1 Tax=Tanacetum coccineum TaxID=301880 RepID=A0ABQ5DFP9_9ASTR